MQYIVPIMSDGMLELSNVLPEDPIEFMSEYIFRRSFEVRKRPPDYIP